MSVDVVVARYKENIDWLETLPQAYKIWIYNKGENNIIKKNYILNELPNVGRESHTYIYHIVSNYDNIDVNGVTVFCQGRIKDHIGHIEESKYIFNIADEANRKGFSESIARWHEIAVIHQPLENFRILEWPPRLFNKPNKNNETFGQWFRRCTKMTYLPPKHEFKWIVAANFAVKNSTILSKPKEYYRSLLDEFDDSSAPEVGHFFERSWYYIF